MDGTRLTIIFLIGVLTYALRVVPQLLLVGKQFSDAADRYLRYLSYALICAIISQVLFMAGNQLDVNAAPHRAIALAITIFVAHRTKNATLGMSAGLVFILAFLWLR